MLAVAIVVQRGADLIRAYGFDAKHISLAFLAAARDS
jgi:hypothetical protein